MVHRNNDLGYPIALTNEEIRLMLRLARASKDDVFYDLGCGYGQLCIVAVQEFGVKRAVGIESLPYRLYKARQRIRGLSLSDRIEIRNEDLEQADFSDGTIVYYGLREEPEDLPRFRKMLKVGCRLITPYMPIISIKPTRIDYPFYLMSAPLDKHKARNKDDWVSSFISKKNASFKDLNDELTLGIPYYTQKELTSLKRMLAHRS